MTASKYCGLLVTIVLVTTCLQEISLISNQNLKRTLPDTPSPASLAFNQSVFVRRIGGYGSGDGFLRFPMGITVNGTGHIYISDSFNNRTQVFTSTGAFVAKWGSGGSGDGEFNGTGHIAINKTGYVYILDPRNYRVQVFTQTGQFITKFGVLGNDVGGKFLIPYGIAINDTGYVYVSDAGRRRIEIFTQTGEWLMEWGSQGSLPGEFNYQKGIAINSTGYVYVADYYNNRTQVFTQTGAFVREWGSTGSGDGQFYGPSGITINSLGHVFVTDGYMGFEGIYSPRIQEFTQTGEFIRKWGSYGLQNGQFDGPEQIANDSIGRVYVVEEVNSRAQVFGNTPPEVFNLAITPPQPCLPCLNNITLSYSFADVEGDAESGTEILWYRNGNHESRFDGQKVIPASWINRTDTWNATVMPRDGAEYGELNWTAVLILGPAPPEPQIDWGMVAILVIGIAAPLCVEIPYIMRLRKKLRL